LFGRALATGDEPGEESLLVFEHFAPFDALIPAESPCHEPDGKGLLKIKDRLKC
jgi:hypothetical protein